MRSQHAAGAAVMLLAVKGREALKKLINDYKQRAAENERQTGQKRPAMYHAAAGREVDELVRVNGPWLIQLREVAPTP